MTLFPRVLAGVFLSAVLQVSIAQPAPRHQGLLPYTPSRIEWLALVLQADLKKSATTDSPFTLSVLNSDHETILIFVRYHPNTDREILNLSVESARQVAQMAAKRYGWSSWVKIKEQVEMAESESDANRH